MRINHNMIAVGASAYNKIHAGKKEAIGEKLASGHRILRSADNAAGLSISEKMRGQIRGLEKAFENVQDGISLIQTADGALNEVHSIVQRMREISVQAANDTNTQEDRLNLNLEYENLIEEIDRIGESTEFNSQSLFDGRFSGSKSVKGRIENSQDGTAIKKANILMYLDFSTIEDGTIFTIGNGADEYNFEFDSDGVLNDTANTAISMQPDTAGGTKADLLRTAIQNTGKFTVDHYQSGTNENQRLMLCASNTAVAGQKIGVTYKGTPGEDLMIQAGANTEQVIAISIKALSGSELELDGTSISGGTEADEAIARTDAAIQAVSEMRSHLGAIQNRLEHSSGNLAQYSENLTASESRIRDIDMADATIEYVKEGILLQASQSILAQSIKDTEQIITLLSV